MTRMDLREKVYLSLRRDLVSGAITATERLGEERLAELYGVSRTPVREALARLQADGLVVRGGDGLHPYRPRVDDLADLYELRRTLEIRGIVRALEDPTLEHDAGLLAQEQQTWVRAGESLPDETEVVLLDEQFHTTLLAASGNTALSEALGNVNARVRPVRILGAVTEDDIRTLVDEHLQIITCMVDGRLHDALTALVAHIDASRDRVIARATQVASLAAYVRA